MQLQLDKGCNPIHINLAVSPTDYNGADFWCIGLGWKKYYEYKFESSWPSHWFHRNEGNIYFYPLARPLYSNTCIYSFVLILDHWCLKELQAKGYFS